MMFHILIDVPNTEETKNIYIFFRSFIIITITTLIYNKILIKISLLIRILFRFFFGFVLNNYFILKLVTSIQDNQKKIYFHYKNFHFNF